MWKISSEEDIELEVQSANMINLTVNQVSTLGCASRYEPRLQEQSLTIVNPMPTTQYTFSGRDGWCMVYLKWFFEDSEPKMNLYKVVRWI